MTIITKYMGCSVQCWYHFCVKNRSKTKRSVLHKHTNNRIGLKWETNALDDIKISCIKHEQLSNCWTFSEELTVFNSKIKATPPCLHFDISETNAETNYAHYVLGTVTLFPDSMTQIWDDQSEGFWWCSLGLIQKVTSKK